MWRTLLDRYQSRLAWQLVLPQLALTLLLGSAGVALVHFHVNQQLAEQLRTRGQFITETIEHAAASAASMDSFGTYVEAMGSARGVEVLIVSGTPTPAVVAATDWSWVGRKLDTLPEEDYRADIVRVLGSGQPHFDVEQGGGALFDYTAPLDLLPLFAGRSVVMVHLHIEDDKRAAEQTARLLSVALMALVFGLLTLQINALRRRVLMPQLRLLASIRAREAGQSQPVAISGKDELAQLTTAYNHLIDTLGRNEQTLLRQQDALIAADRAKTEFLANLSHEIRTPLNGLLGISDLLALEEDNPEKLALIEQMRGSGEALRELLERILDLAHLDMGRIRLSPQPLPLTDTINSTVRRLQRSANERQLTLTADFSPDLPELVMLDGKRLQQILQLLLDNAIKFSERGRIVLSARPAPASAQTIEIDIADEGIGIPPESVERIFDSFVQLDGSATRKVGGNGLGLAIVRRLVTLMGGRIQVLQRPEGGTIMRLHLPVGEISND